jgi:hypothetical protein
MRTLIGIVLSIAATAHAQLIGASVPVAGGYGYLEHHLESRTTTFVAIDPSGPAPSFGEFRGVDGGGAPLGEGGGYDDRSGPWITNRQEYPFRTACKVMSRFGTEDWIHSTGTVVDAETVVVSPDLIFRNSNGGEWASSVVVCVGWDGTGDPTVIDPVRGYYGPTPVTELMVASPSQQVGAVRLARPAGVLTGWPGLVFGDSCNYTYRTCYTRSFPTEPVCTLFGNPLDGTRLFQDGGLFTDCQSIGGGGNYLFSQNFTQECNVPTIGMEGAAMWFTENDQSYVAGLFLSTPEPFPNMLYDSVYWIFTLQDATAIAQFISGSRGNTFDLHALDCDVTPSSLRPGESTTEISFLVANPTNAPAFGAFTYTYGVYLSTDRTITTSDVLLGQGTFFANIGSMDSLRITAPNFAIPANTTAGQRYIGVVIGSAFDSTPSNNDSSDWDAVPITIDPVAPNNNACANATNVPFNQQFNVTNVSATNDGTGSCGGAAAEHEDTWYRFVPPYTGRFRLEALPGGTLASTVISVHTGCPGAFGNTIACTAATLPNLAFLEFNATQGQAVRIRFAGANNTNGTGILRITPAVPINDNCPGTSVGLGTFEGTLRGTTTQGPSCFNATGGDVFFTHIVNCAGEYTISLGGTSDMPNSVLTVFTGCPPTAQNQIICAGTTRPGVHPSVTRHFDVGSLLTIRVSAPTVASAGEFVLSISAANESQDQCADAQQVDAGVPIPFTTCAATPSATNTASGCVLGTNNTVGPDVWFRWTAPAVPVDASFAVCDSTFDTTLVAYLGGCPGSGVQFACADNVCGDDGSISLRTLPSATYLIRVGGAASIFGINDRGSGDLLISTRPVCAWQSDGCAADFNNDGGIDGDDVIGFFGEWDTGGGCADVDASGGVDGDDVILFFGLWDNGGIGAPGC